MDNRKPLCTILWITQVLFVLLAVGFMVLWLLNESGTFGENGIWILTPERSGIFEPLITLVTFAFVGGNYFLLQAVCSQSKDREPELGGPKKLTNRTYRQYIRYRFRDFNVKGLSTHGPYTLELARVYVELSVAPKPFHAASSNIIQLPEKLQSGRHDIWAYVQQTEQNFAIIGPPGCGKTTLLSHVALTLTQSWFRRRKEGVPNKLPILMTLLEHAEAIAAERDEPFAMEDAVRTDLKKWKKEVPEGWVRRSLDNGKYLVLLDGLDEVAHKTQRQKVVAWVERQMKAYPKCQFVVTSRPHGYRTNPIAGVTTLEIRPYDNRQQAQFIRNWYLANEVMGRGGNEDAGVQMAAKEGADDLLRRLGDSPNLAELAVNPLLLTMIATVHRFRSALPKRRVELYDEIFSVFLGTWRGAQGIEQELTPDQRKQVLQPLAWAMMELQVRQISTDEAIKIIREPLRRVDRKMMPSYFLEIVRYQSGLLVERENGQLAFAHLTFQEYLAAMHMQGDETLLNSALTNVRNSWWHETLLLYAAKQDATAIIEACISTIDRLHPKALMLAIDCNEEASQIAPETREKLETVLREAIESNSADEIRRIVAEAWLQRRLKRLSRLSENVYIDSSLIANAEYKLFLEEMLESGQYFQPDHWQAFSYPDGAGLMPVVGVRSGDSLAFCKWLTERSERKYTYRLPNKMEVHARPNLIQYTGYWLIDGDKIVIEMQGEHPCISDESLQMYIDKARYRIKSFDRSHPTIVLSDESARALSRDLFHARTRAKSYLRERDSALKSYIETRIINASNVYNLNLNYSLDLDHAFKLARDVDSSLIRNLNYARELAHNTDNNLARNLDYARKVASGKFYFNTEHDALVNVRSNLYNDLRAVLFFIGYAIDRVLQERAFTTSVFQKQSSDWQKDQTLLEALSSEYFDAFVEVCIIEERIKGNLPAFEGICIVREQVQDVK